MRFIYKICHRSEWREAAAAGVYCGSADDRRDGFIHFSAAHQLRATAQRHFAGKDDLVLLAVSEDDLGAALKWEPSRGGDLFPHLYSDLPGKAVLWEKALPWRDGRHEFPADIPE